MMKLGTLWAHDGTLDGLGSSPIAERILRRWPHDPGSCRFVRSSANVLYVFGDGGARRFLRVAHESERRRETIEAEVALVRWLDDAGLTVARPVASLDGNHVETVATDLGTVHAVVFAGLDGAHLELDHLDEAGFRAWGAALGRLHATLKGCPSASNPDRASLVDRLVQAGRWVDAEATDVRREFMRLRVALELLPIDAGYGLIHGDFELDNLVWNGETVGMLDFDDGARGWYAADVAFALRDLVEAGRGLDDPAVRAFLDGYAGYRPIAAVELAWIPLFSRLARFLTYARIARSLDLEPGDEHPEWLHALAGRFRRRMASYRTSLGA